MASSRARSFSKNSQPFFISLSIGMPVNILATNSGNPNGGHQANHHVQHTRSDTVNDADNYPASLFNNSEPKVLNP